MEEGKRHETHMTSAAAFVEGGIQDSCDDSCSICLEDFCESDPSTVTNCKHEYHLQCILEWCQRSSECPMCMQPIGLKDPDSQELLEAVERERKLRAAPSRNAAIFRHPTLGDFELQHLPVGASNSDLEERILQHLAAAAAMGRAHHFGRREGHRYRQSSHNRPHFLVFSNHPNARSGHVTSSMGQEEGESEPAGVSAASSSATLTFRGVDNPQPNVQFQSGVVHHGPSASQSNNTPAARHGTSDRIHARSSSLLNPDTAGPSELQSFSDSLKSRLNAVSMRYKESISRSTRGWKERLFSRSNTISDIGSEVRREVNAGIASVSRLMERLETRDDRETEGVSESNQSSSQHNSDTRGGGSFSRSNKLSSFATTSSST